MLSKYRTIYVVNRYAKFSVSVTNLFVHEQKKAFNYCSKKFVQIEQYFSVNRRILRILVNPINPESFIMHSHPVNYAFTLPGILKISTIILGTSAYGLGIFSYDETILQEEYFIRSVQYCLIMSLINFIVYLAVGDQLLKDPSSLNKGIDIGYHVTASAILAISSGLIIYSAVDNERTYCQILFVKFPLHFCQFYGAKLAAGIVTLCNSILYLCIAPAIFFSTDGNHKSMRKHVNIKLPEKSTKIPHYYFNSSHI